MQAPRIIKPGEVMGLMKINLKGDREEFIEVIRHLKHGQKDRLLESMVSYPIIDTHFEDEPELEKANIISKRISDSLVAIGLEHTLQGMIAEQERQRQVSPEVLADQMVETTKKRKSKKQEKENEQE
jgi:hypothetical protein